MEATYVSINRWMDKEVVAYIRNRILLSHKKRNPFDSVLIRRLSLELIIQSEVSQKEKNKYCILTHTHIYIWNLERWSWWTYVQGRSGDTDRTDLWTQWGRRGWVNWESSIRTYTGSHVKLDSQWKCTVWCRGLKPVLCNNHEGWDGAGRGRKGGNTCVPVADSCWCGAETNRAW